MNHNNYVVGTCMHMHVSTGTAVFHLLHRYDYEYNTQHKYIFTITFIKNYI